MYFLMEFKSEITRLIGNRMRKEIRRKLLKISNFQFYLTDWKYLEKNKCPRAI